MGTAGFQVFDAFFLHHCKGMRTTACSRQNPSWCFVLCPIFLALFTTLCLAACSVYDPVPGSCAWQLRYRRVYSDFIHSFHDLSLGFLVVAFSLISNKTFTQIYCMCPSTYCVCGLCVRAHACDSLVQYVRLRLYVPVCMHMWLCAPTVAWVCHSAWAIQI